MSGIVEEIFVLLDGGTTSLPLNESQESPAALLPESDGGYQVVFGTGSSNGHFTIPGLPVDGGYFLADPLQASTSFDLTNSGANPSLSFVTLGSPSAIRVQASLPVTIDLSGLQSVGSTQQEEVELVAINDNVFDFAFQKSVTLADGGANPANTVALADGGSSTATSLTGIADWFFVNLPNFSAEVDPTQGDTLTVTQLVLVDAGDDGATTAEVLVAFGDLTGASISAAASTNSVTGALSPLTADTAFSLSVDRAPASASDFPSGTALSYLSVDLSVLAATDAQATAYGSFSATADLFSELALPSGANTPLAVETSYANPYPSTWPVLANLTSAYDLSLTLASTGDTVEVPLGWFLVDRVTDLSASYTPGISPARALTLNGQATSQTLLGVGKTPTLSWTAPSLGTASNYVVAIVQVDPNPGSAPTTQTLAYFTLPGSTTQLQVPDQILDNVNVTASSQFYATVTAYHMPGRDLTQSPFIVTLPQETATTTTNLFSP